MPAIRFVAHGIPVTQGSMRAFVVQGRARITHDTGEKVRSWRSVIAAEAHNAMAGQPLFDEAIEVRLLFHLPKPKSAGKKRPHPDRKPDIDKLVRACLDAMTGVVFADDARVCSVLAEKIYSETPCVVITVEDLRALEPRGRGALLTRHEQMEFDTGFEKLSEGREGWMAR